MASDPLPQLTRANYNGGPGDRQSIPYSLLTLPSYTTEPSATQFLPRELPPIPQRNPEFTQSPRLGLIEQDRPIRTTSPGIYPEDSHLVRNSCVADRQPSITTPEPGETSTTEGLRGASEAGSFGVSLTHVISTSSSARMQRPSRRAPSTRQERSTFISEALQAGAEIYAVHNRTLSTEPKLRNASDQVHKRLQTMYLGELVSKVSNYIEKVGMAGCISESFEQGLYNRALQ